MYTFLQLSIIFGERRPSIVKGLTCYTHASLFDWLLADLAAIGRWRDMSVT